MFADRMTRIAFHEAGHAVVGLHLGFGVLRIDWGNEVEQRPHVVHDETGYLERIPGALRFREDFLSCAVVVRSAAGGCTELRIGVPHERCGWQGDMREFDPRLDELSLRTGHPREQCWLYLSGLAESLIYDDRVWPAIEGVAEAMLKSRVLSGADTEELIRSKWTLPSQNAIFARIASFLPRSSDAT